MSYSSDDGLVYTEKKATYYGYTRGAWFAVACVALVVLIVVLVVVLVPWNTATTQATASQVRTLEQRLAEQHRSDFETERIYSLSDAYRTGRPHTLALCHIGLYQAPPGQVTLSALPPIPTELVPPAAPTTTKSGAAETKQYAILAHFQLQFNADTPALRDMVRRLQLDEGDGRQELIHYELASSYRDFSTVKLVELALDTHRNALKVKREFVACSNNPALRVKRCDHQVDGLMVMNNTRMLPMENPLRPSTKKPKTGANATTTTVTKPKTPAKTEEPQQGIDLTPESQESLKALKNKLTHLRMYFIQFYHAEKPATGRDADAFQEKLVLTIEPNKC